MLAALLREQQTKAETTKALLLGLSAAITFQDREKLLTTLDSLAEGIDAMYVPLGEQAKADKSQARQRQEQMDIELLERVSAF